MYRHKDLSRSSDQGDERRDGRIALGVAVVLHLVIIGVAVSGMEPDAAVPAMKSEGGDHQVRDVRHVPFADPGAAVPMYGLAPSRTEPARKRITCAYRANSTTATFVTGPEQSSGGLGCPRELALPNSLREAAGRRGSAVLLHATIRFDSRGLMTGVDVIQPNGYTLDPANIRAWHLADARDGREWPVRPVYELVVRR